MSASIRLGAVPSVLREALAHGSESHSLVGVDAPLYLNQLAEVAEELGLPPTRFVVRDPMGPRVARRWSEFLPGLLALRECHHRVELQRVSLPGFSPRELARVAPSLDETAVLDGVRGLLELESRDALDVRSATLELALFTPWTRLIDVEISLRRCLSLGLGEWLTRDFRHSWWRAIDGEEGPDGAVRALADDAVEIVRRDGLEALLTEVTLRRGATPPSSGPQPALRRRVIDQDGQKLTDLIRRVGLSTGLKPVWRATTTASGASAAELQDRVGIALHVEPTSHTRDQPAADLAVGRDPRSVRALAAATAETLGRSEGRAEAIGRAGRLLGYPSCCVRSFATGPPWTERFIERALIARRAAVPEPLDPSWIPFLLLHDFYLPCSLRCEASLERAQALGAALAAADAFARPVAWDSYVVVLHLDEPGNAALLVREGPSEKGFRYRPVGGSDSAGRLDPLWRGDALAIEGPETIVLRNGRTAHVFAGDVGVFDSQQVHGDPRAQAAYAAALDVGTVDVRWGSWVVDAPRPEPPFELATVARGRPETGVAIELERLTFGPPDEGFAVTLVPVRGAHRVVPHFVEGAGRPQLHRALTRFLARTLDWRVVAPSSPEAARRLTDAVAATYPSGSAGRRFAGFAVAWPVAREDGRVDLALVRGGEVLDLFVCALDGGHGSPYRTGRSRVGYRGEPPRTARQRAAVEALLKAMTMEERRA